MIDVHLLVYAGTLAVFILGFLAVGVLAVIVFTALATITGIARERRNRQASREYTDVQSPALITAQALWSEEDEARSPDSAEEADSTGRRHAGELVSALRRPGRPQLIQHL